jgi:transcriptional regulator with XRE-family HTH domain
MHEAPYKVLIECLRSARRAANVTQANLAKRLGKGQYFVSKYERGERRVDVVELREICIALDISLTDFLEAFEQKLTKKGSA